MNPDSESILIVRDGGIGDLIVLSSTLKALKQKTPWRPLILATLPEHIPLLKGQPFLDECVSIDEVGSRSFFKIFDLRNAVEPPIMGGTLQFPIYTNFDRSNVFDMLLGVQSEKKFSVNVNRDAWDNVIKIFGEKLFRTAIDSFTLKSENLIGIHATARAPIRSIPPEYIQPLAEKIIQEFDVKVVLFGKLPEVRNIPFWSSMSPQCYQMDYQGLKKIEMPNLINLIDKLNIEEMVALCSLMDFIITADTAPYHIAAALGVKCLALFGNIAPMTRTTYYPTVKTIYAKDVNPLPCIPCWDISEACQPTKYVADCMKSITVDVIMEKMKELWK